jgi:NAD(P)-dependent dehydrogenase (short-subunit alcohol dehydrogenase family)
VDIQGKSALVTGSGYGIGRAIARRLAAEGARVVVNDISEEYGRGTIQLIKASGGTAEFIQADVAREDEAGRMIGFAMETFGRLDILVNNAANEVVPPFFPGAPADRWRRTVEVCLLGTMSATQHAVDAMSRQGGGAVVNLSSLAGIGFGPHDSPEYAAAKAGIMRFTAALAPLGERMNIRVNCIAPNWVATENVLRLVNTLSDEQRGAWHCPPIEELTRPEDIADAVVYLINEDSLAGRVILCDERDSRWIVPTDALSGVFALSERLQ